MWRTVLVGSLIMLGFAVPYRDRGRRQAVRPSRLEGSFEYLAPLRGQGIFADGRFVVLFGPADGSMPMTGHAGTYQIAQDTGSATIEYSTAPQTAGATFRWTAVSWSGDTLAYAVFDEAGQVMDRGRAVKRR
jgi:hypothetical protein